jgi:hypothetical protein
MAGFSADQVGNFDPTAAAGFSADQVGNFDPAAAAGFSAGQLENFDPTAVAGFKADQVGNFDPTAMAGFSADQVGNFDPTAAAGFTAGQLENFDPTAVAGFKADQVQNLDKGAVGGFDNTQFDSLTPDAKNAFDRDNLGGLDQSVYQNLDANGLADLNSTEIQNMPDGDFSRLASNLEDPTITSAAVEDLLPTGWEVDAATDRLTAPPGADLAFRSLDQQADPATGTTVPELPDFSRSLSVGGKLETDNVLAGLDQSLTSAGVDGIEFRQSATGILSAVSTADESVPLGAFIPDSDNMTQAPDGYTPGLAVDDRGAYVLTTGEGYQIPLLPAPRDPNEIVDLSPGATVDIAGGGSTTITGLDGDDTGPVVGKFNPVLETSDQPPGIHRTGEGQDAKILVVYEDGSAQQLSPSIQSETEFEETVKATPGVEDVIFNTDGSINLRYNGTDFVLKPAFDVESGAVDSPGAASLTIDGDQFFFTNSNGDRQQFFVT